MTARWRNEVTGEDEGLGTLSSVEDSIRSRTDYFDWMKEYRETANLLEARIEEASSYVAIGGRNSSLQMSSLVAYTQGGYAGINEALWSGEVTPQNKVLWEEAQDIEGFMKPLGEPQILFRGTTKSLRELSETGEALKAGSVMSLKGFTSTSRSPWVAQQFLEKGRDAVFMEIHAGPQVNAITLANKDSTYNEYETILDYGQQIVVEAILPYGFYSSMSNQEKGVVVRCRVVEPDETLELMKAPPPGPPPRPGLAWNPTSHRWIRPGGNSGASPSGGPGRRAAMGRQQQRCMGIEMPEGYSASVCPVVVRRPWGRGQGWKVYIRLPDGSWHAKTGRVYDSEEQVRGILREAVAEDALGLSKAGPPYPEPPGGPPPGKEDKVWNPQTARWRNPPESSKVEEGRKASSPSVEGVRRRVVNGETWGALGIASGMTVRTSDGKAARILGGLPDGAITDWVSVDVETGQKRGISDIHVVAVLDPNSGRMTPIGEFVGVDMESIYHPYMDDEVAVPVVETSAVSAKDGDITDQFEAGYEVAREYEARVREAPAYTRIDVAPSSDDSVQMALDRYLRDAQGINEVLRSGKVPKTAKVISANMKELKESPTLFRVMVLSMDELRSEDGQDWQSGTDVLLKGLISTSRNPSYMTEVMKDNQEEGEDTFVVLEIEPHESTLGMVFASDETWYPEWETLLDYGQIAQVDSIQDASANGQTFTLIKMRMREAGVTLNKAPPGPPPRKNLVWYEPTHRWRKPKGHPEEQPYQWVRTGPTIKGIDWIQPREQEDPKGKAYLTTLSGQRIAPGLTDVVINGDPKGDTQAVGLNKNGSIVYVMSEAYWERSTKAKYARQREFAKGVSKLLRQATQDFNASDEAKALHIIGLTGFRIGSERGIYGGVTTLELDQVKARGNQVTFDFLGKSGVRNSKVVTSKVLAQYVRSRKKEGKGSEQLLGTSDARVRRYMQLKGFSGFTPKDFRTYHATQLAAKHVKEGEKPQTVGELERRKKEIATRVADWLHNTPAVALGSYIDPRVFRVWERALSKAEAPYNWRRAWEPEFDWAVADYGDGTRVLLSWWDEADYQDSVGQLSKAPPGPPPPGKEHLTWRDWTRRWVLPDGHEIETPSAFDPHKNDEGFLRHLVFQQSHVQQEEGGIEHSPSYVDILEEGEEVAALEHYVQEGYRVINEGLRGGNPSQEAQLISALMSPAKRNQLLYRGTGLEPEDFLNDEGNPAQVGDVLTPKAFMSCSRNPLAAFMWQHNPLEQGDNNILLEIDVEPRTFVVTIANKDTQNEEYETIIDHHQQMVVEGITWVQLIKSSRLRPVYRCRMLSREERM